MKNLEMVKVRLVSDYKLHSEEPITSNEDAVELLKRELSEYDREAICVLNLLRYTQNDKTANKEISHMRSI